MTDTNLEARRKSDLKSVITLQIFATITGAVSLVFFVIASTPGENLYAHMSKTQDFLTEIMSRIMFLTISGLALVAAIPLIVLWIIALTKYQKTYSRAI